MDEINLKLVQKAVIGMVLIFLYIVSIGDTAELPVHGFIDYSLGSRVVNDRDEKDDVLLNEVRMQLETGKSIDKAEFRFKGDVIYDSVTDSTDIEIREGNIILYPTDILEIKVGRQILTWGTGEYLFINDMFPKNWQSFFTGRDDEYLKAPSNTIKFSMYPEVFDIDIAWTPVFEPDTFVTGERLSYFNTLTGAKGGDGTTVTSRTPNKKIMNSEWGLRINKNISGTELSLYGYKGFYKRPLGYDALNNVFMFPELAVYGASARGQVAGGVWNIEGGYYDSLDDRNGKNGLIENSDIKALAGYSQDVITDFTVGVQYYIEHMINYKRYVNSYSAEPSTKKDETRHLVTLSLTKLFMMQTLRASLFTFYSPSDEDTYIRPSVTYKWTDNIAISGGGNIFVGQKKHTFFGQLSDNSNVYARLRYSF